MISPNFATMLCFVQTDAVLAPQTADLLLGVCVKRSFDRCSVDGQLSTNDTAILMCSGASGVDVAPESEDELRFGEALDALLRQLAIMMVADGEGAGRIARVVVRGGDPGDVEAAARAVANSPLVKTALHGGDPNWGRIVQAVGGALGGRDRLSVPLAMDLFIEGTQVCSGGAAIAVEESALARAVAAPEVEYVIRLPGEGAETEVFFSDLSHRVRHHQRRLHHLRGRDARRRHAARGPALHTRVSRQDRRDQVRRRRDGGPRAARGVRPRRGAAQVRRAESDRGPRRRAGHHGLHAAPRPARPVRRRAARLRRRHRRDRQDGARRQGQQGDRGPPRPPRTAGRGALRRRRLAVRSVPARRARRRGHRLRRAHRARQRRRAPARRERLHPRDRVRRRRPRRAAPTTSTPTRPPAPSRARWAPTRWCSSPTSPAGWPTPRIPAA